MTHTVCKRKKSNKKKLFCDDILNVYSTETFPFCIIYVITGNIPILRSTFKSLYGFTYLTIALFCLGVFFVRKEAWDKKQC